MSNKKNILIILILSFILPSTLRAADFDVDHAAFRGNEEISILEIYLLIPRNLFEFVKAEGGYFRSDILIRAALVQNDTVKKYEEWTLIDKLQDKSMDISTQKIPEIVSFQTPPGTYKLIIFVADINTKKKHRYEEVIQLPAFQQDKLQLSDINLASQVAKTQTKNKFSKYFGYDLMPNASDIFGDAVPIIYPYCEIYNLAYNANSPGNYQIRYVITDIGNQAIRTYDWQAKEKPGVSAVALDLNGIDIQDFSSGLYNLRIDVVDNATQDTTSEKKRFYILKQDNQNTYNRLLEQSRLMDMDMADLDSLFGPLSYIATNSEQKQYKNSDIKGKREVIANFWKGRDPDPETTINEKKVNFERKLNYVNQQFGTGSRAGWKTDMGRIFLIYGPPSDIERHPSSLESKPYQIWYYHGIEGGVEFVFVDKTGFGRMELVHSTARNELQDYNWKRFINQAGGY